MLHTTVSTPLLRDQGKRYRCRRERQHSQKAALQNRPSIRATLWRLKKEATPPSSAAPRPTDPPKDPNPCQLIPQPLARHPFHPFRPVASPPPNPTDSHPVPVPVHQPSTSRPPAPTPASGSIRVPIARPPRPGRARISPACSLPRTHPVSAALMRRREGVVSIVGEGGGEQRRS